jgi:hypothetical protein
MLKRQPAVIDLRHSCRALRTSAIDSPFIDPDSSTRKMTSAGSVPAGSVGTNPTAIAARPSLSRSTHARGWLRPSAATVSTKSRSSAVVVFASVTVVLPSAMDIEMGCEGDSTRAMGPGIDSVTARSRPYGTRQASGGFSASASERPRPTRSGAGA